MPSASATAKRCHWPPAAMNRPSSRGCGKRRGTTAHCTLPLKPHQCCAAVLIAGIPATEFCAFGRGGRATSGQPVVLVATSGWCHQKPRRRAVVGGASQQPICKCQVKANPQTALMLLEAFWRQWSSSRSRGGLSVTLRTSSTPGSWAAGELLSLLKVLGPARSSSFGSSSIPISISSWPLLSLRFAFRGLLMGSSPPNLHRTQESPCAGTISLTNGRLRTVGYRRRYLFSFAQLSGFDSRSFVRGWIGSCCSRNLMDTERDL